MKIRLMASARVSLGRWRIPKGEEVQEEGVREGRSPRLTRDGGRERRVSGARGGKEEESEGRREQG
jgi:hypothetical protein